MPSDRPKPSPLFPATALFLCGMAWVLVYITNARMILRDHVSGDEDANFRLGMAVLSAGVAVLSLAMCRRLTRIDSLPRLARGMVVVLLLALAVCGWFTIAIVEAKVRG